MRTRRSFQSSLWVIATDFPILTTYGMLGKYLPRLRLFFFFFLLFFPFFFLARRLIENPQPFGEPLDRCPVSTTFSTCSNSPVLMSPYPNLGRFLFMVDGRWLSILDPPWNQRWQHQTKLMAWWLLVLSILDAFLLGLPFDTSPSASTPTPQRCWILFTNYHVLRVFDFMVKVCSQQNPLMSCWVNSSIQRDLSSFVVWRLLWILHLILFTTSSLPT